MAPTAYQEKAAEAIGVWETGFDDSVSLGDVFVDGGQWWQEVLGIPPLPGGLVAGHAAGFQLQVGEAFAPLSPDPYVKNTIVEGWEGANGRSLHQNLPGPSNPLDPFGNVRSNWFFNQNFESFGDEWTQKMRVFHQENLEAVMDPRPTFTFNFRQLWECKIGPIGLPPTLRYGFGLVWNVANGLQWQLAGEIVDGAPLFDLRSDTPPIPEDDWYDFEIFVKFAEVDGIIRAKIDNQVVFEIDPQMTTPVPLDEADSRWKLTSLYTNLDRGTPPFFQVVDSIRLEFGKFHTESVAQAAAYTERSAP